MNERQIALSSVTRSRRKFPTVGIPTDVDELLGEPENIAWFLDEDTGLIYVVPDSEVEIK